MWGLVRPALSAAGARAIVHVHLEPSEEEMSWTLKRPPAHIVTCARYIAGEIAPAAEAVGVGVTTVPNAVNVERFRAGDPTEARRRVNVDTTSAFVVLMLANLAPHKGQMTAIRAIGELRRRGVDAQCWLVGEERGGDGSYSQALQTLATELGVGAAVRFLGFRTDIVDLLHAADAFILPSTREGLPLSILEAQAAGVPVVASTIPGVLELVDDGQTGFVVPSDDAVGYADRLMLLASQPDLRGRLIAAAEERVRREHSWQTFEDRMFAVYASIAGRER
jgi:glycosyltransferase involved in cell wall biosynthesis